ncbi:MAG TPA: immunoglobulin domain-containing protein [Verrucomicrobiae bacterium]|nr:immunoglobulin domain-containing protein [Verrucomicrobiae bacterium]
MEEIWTKAGSPYVIEGDILVASLDIRAGVQVLFASNCVFEVAGTLKAIGSSQEPIVFARMETSIGWKGIFFNYSGEGSELGFVNIRDSVDSGIRVLNSQPIIRNCLMADNGGSAGGGMSIVNGFPKISACIFSNNFSGDSGGGLSLLLQPGTTQEFIIENTAFVQNRSARYGGGLFVQNGKLRLSGVKFSRNAANNGAGAMNAGRTAIAAYNCLVEGSSGPGGGVDCNECESTWNNCIFRNNSGGGLKHAGWPMALSASNCIVVDTAGGEGISINGRGNVVNCTVAYNSSTGIGAWSSEGIQILNSIIFFNAAQISSFQNYPPTVSFSDVQNGFSGFGNINLNPIVQSRSNMMLVVGSPCIDRGDTNSAYNDVCFPPSRGSDRNDMGAYGGPGTCRWITGDEPTIVMQPRPVSSCIGLDVLLSVRAIGAEPLFYQWYFNETNRLIGETRTNLVRLNVQSEDAGFYSVLVSNGFGTVSSTSARVLVFDACVSIGMYAGLSITGQVGRTYTVSSTTDLNSESWLPMATNTLSEPYWFFLDSESAFRHHRFYRVDLQR